MDNETLNIILASVVVPVLIALSTFLVRWLNKKTEEIQAAIKSKQLAEYIDIAEDAVVSSISTVFQVYVDAIKKANGFLTPEEADVAFKLAKNKTLAILSIAAKEAVIEVYNDLDEWLNNTIEYYVKITK